MDKKRFVIQTGGFVLYFFSGLIILFLVLFVGGVKQFTKEISSPKDIISLLGLLMFIWIIVYLLVYLRSNKIEVRDDNLNVSFVDRSRLRSTFMPKVIKGSIKLQDIESVTIGRGKLVLPASSSFLLKLTPFIQIQSKEGKPIMIDTKPFSRNGCRKLIEVFQERGIPVEIHQNVL